MPSPHEQRSWQPRVRILKYFAIIILLTLTILLRQNSPLEQPSRYGPIHANQVTPASAIRINHRQRYPKTAFMVKTGAEVLVQRSAIQIQTFLKDIKNLLFIGEEAGHRLGDYAMLDVYSGSYERAMEALGITPDESHLRRRDPPLMMSISKPDMSKKGYKVQAHKNLPGLRALYQTFPDADWYILMDDDSYIFLDTMHNYLADFNASEPYYIGASNRFKGCGIKSYSESPRFAHGSAIVLSHVALKRLQPHIDKCIVDYQECFAGDVRTALCLRDAGINLTRAEGRGFWKFAPNHEFTWPKDPCSKPIVFHHLLSEQIQRLYTLERHPRNPHIGVTTSEIYHAFYTPKHKFDNIARRGEKPLAVHENATETACLDACVLDTECVVWTMEAGKCELFDQVFEGKPVDGAVSEVLPDRYICHVGI